MMVDAEELKHVLRGLLISVAPDKCMTVKTLHSDYVKDAGKEYPYKELGFNTFLDYLKSIPDAVKLLNPHSRDSIVVGVASSKNAHLQELVATQKTNTPRGSRKRYCPVRSSSRYPYQEDRYYDQYHEVVITASAQNRVFNFLQQFTVEGVSKGDFIDFLYNVKEIDPNLKKNIPSLMKALRHLIFYRKGRIFANWNAEIIPDKNNTDDHFKESHGHSSVVTDPSSESEPCNIGPEQQLIELDIVDTLNTLPSKSSLDPPSWSYNGLEHEHEELEDIDKEDVESIISSVSSSSDSSVYEARNIPIPDISSDISRRLKKNLIGLIDKNPKGIWLTDLCKKYEKEYGYTLQVKQYDCYNLFQFVSQLPTIFYITKLSAGGHILLRDARKYKDDDESPTLPKEIRDNIVDVIKKRFCVRIDQLEKEYKLLHGKPLVAQDHNFSSLDDLILHLDDYLNLKAVGGKLLLSMEEVTVDEVPEYLMINHCTSKEDNNVLALAYKNVYPEGVCGKGFFIPQQELPSDCSIGSRIEILMAQVDTPCLFYVHLYQHFEKLDNMMTALNMFYEDKEKRKEWTVNEENIHVGLYCVCKYEYDRLWYRVRVINAEDKNAIKVRFIDYGTFGFIEFKQLKYLSNKFTDLPAQGIYVEQIGMLPTIEDGKWTAKTRDALLDMSNQDFIMQVVSFKQVEENEDLEIDFPILECHVLRKSDKSRLSTILIALGRARPDEPEKGETGKQIQEKPKSTNEESTSSNGNSEPKRKKNNKSKKEILETNSENICEPEPMEIAKQVETLPMVAPMVAPMDAPKPVNRAKLGPPPGFAPRPCHKTGVPPPRYESPPDYVSATSDPLIQSAPNMAHLSAACPPFVPRMLPPTHDIPNPSYYQPHSPVTRPPQSPHPIPFQHSNISNYPPNVANNIFLGATLSKQPVNYEPFPPYQLPYYQYLHSPSPPHQPSLPYPNIRTPCQRPPTYHPAAPPSVLWTPVEIQHGMYIPQSFTNYAERQAPFTKKDVKNIRLPPGLAPPTFSQRKSSFGNVKSNVPTTGKHVVTNGGVGTFTCDASEPVQPIRNGNASNYGQARDTNVALVKGMIQPFNIETSSFGNGNRDHMVGSGEGRNIAEDMVDILNCKHPTMTWDRNASTPVQVTDEEIWNSVRHDGPIMCEELWECESHTPSNVIAERDMVLKNNQTSQSHKVWKVPNEKSLLKENGKGVEIAVSKLVDIEREAEKVSSSSDREVFDLIDFGDEFDCENWNNGKLTYDPFEIVDDGKALENPLSPVRVNGEVRNKTRTLDNPLCPVKVDGEVRRNENKNSGQLIDIEGLMSDFSINDDTFIKVPPPRVARSGY